MSVLQVHGTCVAFEAGAVLLRGPAGVGKSDLAFRLVSEQGGHLVADDQVCLESQRDGLVAQAKKGWTGLIELRGLGIVSIPSTATGPLTLLVDLVGREEVPRLAEPSYDELVGHRLPVLRLHAFDATTPAKVRLAVTHIPDYGAPGSRTGGFPGEDGRLG